MSAGAAGSKGFQPRLGDCLAGGFAGAAAGGRPQVFTSCIMHGASGRPPSTLPAVPGVNGPRERTRRKAHTITAGTSYSLNHLPLSCGRDCTGA